LFGFDTLWSAKDDEYVVFQDNMSTLLLDKHGRILSSKQAKHIKATYFFIKDYYDAGEIGILSHR
jgi:hypothetical protein